MLALSGVAFAILFLVGWFASEARVPEAAAAAIMGHSLAVFHGSHVKAHRDALERDSARDALVELGLGVTPAQTA